MTPSSRTTDTSGFLDDAFKDTTIYFNLAQEILNVTVDKVELCLLKHQGTLRYQSGWIAPLGVFLTLLLALVTTDTRNALGVSKDSWCAVFLLALAAAAVWLVIAMRDAWRYRGKHSVTYIIETLKGERAG